MKILALGDPHGILPKNLDTIIKKNNIETIICVGDFAFTPPKPWIKDAWKGINRKFIDSSYKKVVDKLCSYKIPVISLRGNMYMTKKGKLTADKILIKNKNLLTRFTGKIKIKEKTFILFDMSYEPETIHKTSDTPRDVTNFQKRRMNANKKRENKLNKMLKENPNSILITHNPPYGKVDLAYNQKHVGSKIIKNAIIKNQPKLILCGHIHEAKGEAKIRKSQIYNLGHRGDYQILEI